MYYKQPISLPVTEEALEARLETLVLFRPDIVSWVLIGRLCLRSPASGRGGLFGVICRIESTIIYGIHNYLIYE